MVLFMADFNYKIPSGKTLSPNSLSAGGFDTWPGQKRSPGEDFDDDCPWNPTGFGPGIGPDLSAGVVERQSVRVLISSPHTERASLFAEPIDLAIQELREELAFRENDICPHCGFARLSIDEAKCLSCPICFFGSSREYG